MLLCVPTTSVPEWWPAVAPLLARAIDHSVGGDTLETVRASVEHGDALLWIDVEGEAIKSALAASIMEYPSGERRLHLSLCGGRDLPALRAALSQIEAWAREQGIRYTQVVNGRAGWGRALGYRETGRVFMKDLTDG